MESHEYPLSQIIRGGKDYSEIDVQYQRGDGSTFWMRIVGRPVLDDKGTRIGAAVALLDIDNERDLLSQQEILIGELNHRVKNAFTVVKSIVSQSLRGAETSSDIRDTIDARLPMIQLAESPKTALPCPVLPWNCPPRPRWHCRWHSMNWRRTL